MALNTSFIGKAYPPGPAYQVGREKIREFATAIGDPNPVYHDVAAAQAAGYPDLVGPPTFAFSLAMRALAATMFDPELGLDYSRVVHGEQRFAYERPIVAGDTLVVTASIEDIRSVAGNEVLTTRSVLTDEAGEPVVTLFNVIVSRGTAAQEG